MRHKEIIMSPEITHRNQKPAFFRFALICAAVCLLTAGSAFAKQRAIFKSLDLSGPLTTERLMAAGQLGGELYPTSPIDPPSGGPGPEPSGRSGERAGPQVPERQKLREYNLTFAEAIEAWNRHDYRRSVRMFKGLARRQPDSPWVDEALLHLGCEARYNGRYAEADDYFSKIKTRLKGNSYIGARMVYYKAVSRQAVMRALENDREGALRLFSELKTDSPDWRHRTYASHFLQRLSREKAAGLAAYNCGIRALAHILRKEGRISEAEEVEGLTPVSERGSHLKQLKEIAGRYGYPAEAVRLEPGAADRIVPPAVVLVKRSGNGADGHYLVLEAIQDGRFTLFDPQSGRRFAQSLETFASAWSGRALAFAVDALPQDAILDSLEMESVFGSCCGIQRPESDLGDPGSGQACGSPAWSVNMVNLNLFIKDVPIWSRSEIGPAFFLQLSYNSQSATSRNEPFGNKWVFNYGTYLVTDPGGTVTLFMPDGRRDVYAPASADPGNTAFTPPRNVYNRLEKTGENRFELTFTDDTVHTYAIPPGILSQQPFLTAVTDKYGHSLNFFYDERVRLSRVLDASGREFRFIYNEDSRVIEIRDPFGRSAEMEYDASGNLTAITDMGGFRTGFGYDEDIYLTFMENDRGRWGFYTEPADGVGNSSVKYSPPGTAMWENYRITVTDPLGGVEEYYYQGYNGYSWHVAPIDYVPYANSNENTFKTSPQTRYYFKNFPDGSGKISRITTPEGVITSFSYDSRGRKTSVARGGLRISYAYNDMGRVTRVTRPGGNVTEYIYNDNQLDVREIKTGLGSQVFTYNEHRDIATVTDINGSVTPYEYNPYGRIVTATDPKGTKTLFRHDEAGRLIEASVNGQAMTRMTYDAAGRPITVADVDGLELAFAYNNLDRLIRATWPDGRREDVSYSSCCPDSIDHQSSRNGLTASHTHDAAGRVVKTVNQEGGRYRYEYDPNGNLSRLLDPGGRETRFEYDLDNRLTRKIDADGRFVRFEYDRYGRLETWVNARGVSKTYSYDSGGYLAGIDYSDDTPDVRFTVDEYGRLVERTDGAGEWRFEYYSDSRLKSVDGPWENDTVTYAYDAPGRRTALTLQGGRKVSYGWDAFDRLREIRAGSSVHTYEYNGAGRLVRTLSGPAGAATYAYNGLKQLESVTDADKAGNTVSRHIYSYNDRGLIETARITGGLPVDDEARRTAYSYNSLNQIQTESSAKGEKTFAWDDDGNQTRGYTPDGYEFIAAYDAENRLKRIEYTDSGGRVHRTEYIYSGDNLLAVLKKFEDNEPVRETRIVRDGFLAIQDRDKDNRVHREYLWGLNYGGGIGGLLSVSVGGAEYSAVYDGRGNLVKLKNQSGTTAAEYAYDEYGNISASTGDVDQDFLFSTKRYDRDTGLIYFGYRYYTPSLGRWITRDPIQEAGGVNLYAYVLNDPVNFIDPWGLWVFGGNFGGSITFGGMKFSLSTAVLIDSRGNIGIVTQQEAGAGIGKSASLFNNAVFGWDSDPCGKAEISDYAGTGTSLSRSYNKVTGSIAMPDANSSVKFIEAGVQPKSSWGAEVGLTRTFGQEYSFNIFNLFD